MRSRMRLVLVGAAGMAFLLAGSAIAQKKKITLEDLVIEGNIQKPEAFFILPRKALNFADLERREDLRRKVIESVAASPF
jgi:hypothetical protein